MEKKFFFLVCLFLLTMIGCQEERIVPGPDPVLKSTLTAWALPESVAYKGTVTIYWQSENLSCLSINGRVYLELTGSVAMTGLVKDTVFNFKGTSIDGLWLNESIHIKVGPAPVVITPITAKDTLCSMYWMLTEERVFFKGEWWETILGEARRTNKLHFYADGKLENISKDNVVVANGDYEIRGDSLRMGNYWFKFLLTNKNDTVKFSRIRIAEADTTVNVWTGYHDVD